MKKLFFIMILAIPLIGIAQEKKVAKFGETGVKANPVADPTSSKPSSPAETVKEFIKSGKKGRIILAWIYDKNGDETKRYFQYFQEAGQSYSKAKEQIKKRYKNQVREGEKLDFRSSKVNNGQCAVIYSLTEKGKTKYGLLDIFNSEKKADEFIKDDLKKDGYEFVEKICN